LRRWKEDERAEICGGRRERVTLPVLPSLHRVQIMESKVRVEGQDKAQDRRQPEEAGVSRRTELHESKSPLKPVSLVA
jgi:hypothetical protein